MDKIAEIVCPKCMYNGRECGAGYATTEDCPQVRDIQALITQRESALRSENEQLKQQGKAKDEALRDAKMKIWEDRYKEAITWGQSHEKSKQFADGYHIIAKIDAALEGGKHE